MGEQTKCPDCGLPYTRFAKPGDPNCIIRGGEKCQVRTIARLRSELAGERELADAAELALTLAVIDGYGTASKLAMEEFARIKSRVRFAETDPKGGDRG